MNKNQKVVVASVGLLCLLIGAVLVSRSPAHNAVKPPEPTLAVQAIAPDTPKPEVANSQPTASPVQDDSHKAVTKLIDDIGNSALNRAPGFISKAKETMNWFLGFDTAHAIILIIVVVFVIGIVAEGGRRGASKKE